MMWVVLFNKPQMVVLIITGCLSNIESGFDVWLIKIDGEGSTGRDGIKPLVEMVMILVFLFNKPQMVDILLLDIHTVLWKCQNGENIWLIRGRTVKEMKNGIKHMVEMKMTKVFLFNKPQMVDIL